jgi:membrane-associated protease RseP (regulator of RpoE activity)
VVATLCAAGWTGTNGFHVPKTTTTVPRSSSSRIIATPTHPLARQSSRSTTRLPALPLAAATAASPLGAITVLATIVLIHEAGHYLAARALFGMDVAEFSVGVGPKVFGFEAFGNDFSLRLLPLGGYVRFPEHYNVTQVQELEDEGFNVRLGAEAEPTTQANVPTTQAAGAAAATAPPNKLLNLLSLGAMERNRQKEEAAAAAAKEVALEKQPWWNFGRQRSDDKEEDGQGQDVEVPYYDNPNLLQNRPWTERAVVLSGGVVRVSLALSGSLWIVGHLSSTRVCACARVSHTSNPCLPQIFNLLLAFSIYFGEISYGGGVPSPIFEPGIMVSAAPRPQGASAGLLRKGDVILDINGRALTSSVAPTVFESQRAMSDLIATIRATRDGDDVQLTVQRDRAAPQVVRIQPQRVVSASGTSAVGPPSIGILMTPNYVKSAVLKSSNPIEAAGMAAKYASTITTETANGLLSALGGIFSPQGSSGSQVSGPIGLIRTGSEVVATQDSTAVLLFMAALSINLGVVNALPLPALDGGQLLFVLAEAATGRKIDQRIQEGITGVAVLFLLFVSVGAAVGDLTNLLGR